MAVSLVIPGRYTSYGKQAEAQGPHGIVSWYGTLTGASGGGQWSCICDLKSIKVMLNTILMFRRIIHWTPLDTTARKVDISVTQSEAEVDITSHLVTGVGDAGASVEVPTPIMWTARPKAADNNVLLFTGPNVDTIIYRVYAIAEYWEKSRLRPDGGPLLRW